MEMTIQKNRATYVIGASLSCSICLYVSITSLIFMIGTSFRHDR